MATTSPDNLFSPDASSQYALTTDLALMQQSVQTALGNRANFYRGTSTQRTALSTAGQAQNGTFWADTNGTQLLYRYDGTNWQMWNPDTVSAVGGRASAFSVPNGAFTAVPWLSADSTSSPFITVGNNGRFTLNAGAPSGRYMFTGLATFSNSTGGTTRASTVFKNGSAITGYSTGVGQQSVPITTEIDLIAGDYVTYELFQNSGGTLATVGGTNYTLRATLRYAGR